MPDQLSFEVLGASFTVNISLPFRWAVFYFMACCYVIAQATYALACPKLIKKYADFRSYRTVHSGMSGLTWQLIRLSDRARKGEEFVADLLRTWAVSVGYTGHPDLKQTAEDYLIYLRADKSGGEYSLEKFVADCSKDERVLDDLFQVILAIHSKEKPTFRLLSVFFFCAGTLLFGLLCVQSLITVIKMI